MLFAFIAFCVCVKQVPVPSATCTMDVVKPSGSIELVAHYASDESLQRYAETISTSVWTSALWVFGTNTTAYYEQLGTCYVQKAGWMDPWALLKAPGWAYENTSVVNGETCEWWMLSGTSQLTYYYCGGGDGVTTPFFPVRDAIAGNGPLMITDYRHFKPQAPTKSTWFISAACANATRPLKKTMPRLLPLSL